MSASNYDSWKTTDSTYEHGDGGGELCMQCIAIIDHCYRFCKIPYEEHNDEEIGHAFVTPDYEDNYCGPDGD